MKAPVSSKVKKATSPQINKKQGSPESFDRQQILQKIARQPNRPRRAVTSNRKGK